jgi:hypothetical protein
MHAFLNKGLAVQGRTEEVLRHGSTTARAAGGSSSAAAPANKAHRRIFAKRCTTLSFLLQHG